MSGSHRRVRVESTQHELFKRVWGRVHELAAADDAQSREPAAVNGAVRRVGRFRRLPGAKGLGYPAWIDFVREGVRGIDVGASSGPEHLARITVREREYRGVRPHRWFPSNYCFFAHGRDEPDRCSGHSRGGQGRCGSAAFGVEARRRLAD